MTAKRIPPFTIVLVILTLALAACQNATPEPTQAPAEEEAAPAEE